MAIEIGALTLAVGVDKGTVIQQLRQIDAAVEQSAKRGARANYSAAKEYREWWRDALRQREVNERRVFASQKAEIRAAASEFKKASAEMAAEDKKSETQNANYWMARRRYLRGYQSEFVRLLNERDRLEAASQNRQAAYFMAKMRRERAMSIAHSQALRMDAAMTEAAQRRAAAASAKAVRDAQANQRALQRQMAMASRTSAAGARAGGSLGPGLSTFGITGTLLGTAGLAQLVETANQMQVVQQRLDQVSRSTTETKLVFDTLAGASQRLRQPLGQMAELYSKLRQSNENVGLSANETLKVTEAFTAALRLSGATGQTAASALLQFGQAMAKGNLDGDEFRTIAENNSEVLLVLQREYGKTRAEILKMREEGQLTARMMADALIKEYDRLIDRATKLAPTLGQGATALKNSLLIILTNSTDAREAIEDLGKAMVNVADFLQGNGRLIIGLTGTATALWGVHRAITAINLALASGGLARLMTFLASPVGIGVAVLGGAATLKNLENENKQREKAAKLIEFQKKSEKELEFIINQKAISSSEMQRQYDEQIRKGVKASPDLMIQLHNQIQAEHEIIRLAQEALAIKKAQAAMATKEKPVEPPKPEETKKAKDTLDAYINSVIELLAAGKATEAEFDRLNQILLQQRQILASSADPIVKAQALDRIQRIMQGLQQFYFVNQTLTVTSDRVKVLADNFELLSDYMTVDDIQLVITYMKKLQEEIDELNVGTEEHLKKARELAELRKSLMDYVSIKGPKPDEKELTPQEERAKQLRDQLIETLRQAPEDVFIGFFDALGRQWADGSQKLGEQMRSIIGGLFSQIGQLMIRSAFNNIKWDAIWKVIKSGYGMLIAKMGGVTGVLGKFLTSIKAFLTNPLTAGPALVAIGAAMVAYGAKMGSLGRGGGADSGLIGTIGGLGVGGTQKPLIYTFGNQQNPFQGARSAAAAAGAVVVNATVIGPNDPQAQAQIAKLVDNAARRGLMNGSGMRTG